MPEELTLSELQSVVDEYLTPLMREALPFWFTKRADETPERIWEMPFKELNEAAYNILEDSCGKGQATTRIRAAFWQELERSTQSREAFQFFNILGAVCSPAYFKRLCEERRELVAWLLTPPNSYKNRLLELTLLGEERMMEILQAQAVRPDGKVDARLAQVQVKLWEILQDRLYGGVVQRQENKNVNVDINAKSPQGQALVGSVDKNLTVEEIQKRIAGIKERVEQLTSPAPIRVDAQKLVQPAQGGEPGDE